MKKPHLLLAALLFTGLTLAPDVQAQNQGKGKGKGKGQPAGADINLGVPRDQVIAPALYTVHEGTLELNARLFPLKDGESRDVRLEVKKGDASEDIATVQVNENGYGNAKGDKSWTALLRIENWGDTQDVPYRVAHGDAAYFEGLEAKQLDDAAVVEVEL